jgi:putative PIN family toxin of toxin-antitoxin system
VARRITADTNVYVSALNFGGIPEEILTLARAGVLELAISDPILAEIGRVLTRKFHWTSGPLTEALLEIAAYTVRIHPTEKLDIVIADPSDNCILECAIGASSEYIVSGDTHLLRLREHAGIPILRPSELLELLRKKGL